MSASLISMAGMLTLLGLAWLLSYDRSAVNIRQLGWGLGLQVTFALIVLKDNYWSFIGMSILGLLIITFLLREAPLPFSENRRLRFITTSLIGLMAGTIVYAFTINTGIVTLKILIAALLISLAVNSWRRWNPALQPFFSVFLIASVIILMVVNNWHGQYLFKTLGDKVTAFLSMSDYGAAFLFGNLVNPKYFFPQEGTWPGFGFQFAFKVLPTIIFFGAFMSLLYYAGIMQKIIEALSRFMRWTLGTSGAETMSCTANIFVGQTEAPLLVKPFLEGMTRSELLTIMVGGFATIAGGVLAGYIAMGIPASHLIAASVMGAPAALVIGKLIYPEKEMSQTLGDVQMPDIKTGSNIIEAIANGISDGFRLAVNVGAMLIGFIALVALADWLLNIADAYIDGRLLQGTYVQYSSAGLSPATGEYTGYFPGSVRTIFGSLLKPIAFLMGVPWEDASYVGNLIGIKLSLNEFVAYGTMSGYILDNAISQRSVVIATYALCGFANFSSIGIQIGGISALAPSRKGDLSRIGLKAMFGGAIASCLNATIAGMLL
ncbi:MAG: hypothetical protein KatS3mg031_0707 [Chitinophagales bacterium]|nr:MAG: hypothetical protein KatS3mg031_0707 [Chitinophagales bacterium]